MSFIPDTIILNTSGMVRLFQERLEYLRLHELELKELISFVMNSLTYQDVAMYQLEKCVYDIKQQYAQIYSQHELKYFGSVVHAFGIELFRYLQLIRIYTEETVCPYHFQNLIPGGDIILTFDYSEMELLKW